MDDIEKVINEDKEKSGQTGASGPEAQKPTDEELKKAQALKELADIEAAKVAATAELQRVRAEKRQVKKQPDAGATGPVEKVIDENDPDAKPWLNKIKDSVSPVQEELDREKAEVRQLALDDFLSSRPILAKNPDKLKELMQIYDRIHTATERNKEGVLRDLDKAYAAVYHQELLEAAQQKKVGDARRDALFSDIAVSRGSTAYTSPKEDLPKLSPEDERILARWNMSPQEWQKMKVEQAKKLEQSV